MGCLILLIILALVLGAGMWLTVGLIALLATFVVAGVIGWAADLIIPAGALPGGWFGAVLTGLIGGFVGHLVFGLLRIQDPGPALFGVHVIPAFVGAVIVALAAQLFTARRPVV
jgi:uncharacterized membrane protein YeaQ/YmgE (transglycosylase-associated protein family)